MSKAAVQKRAQREQQRLAAANEPIFPVYSLDRSKIHWEDYLHHFTPVERVGRLWVKRDDKFAPLGPDGVNGGKVRQIVWVLTQYQQQMGGGAAVIMAGSVKSPQVGRVPTVARHLGIPITVVIASDPEKAARRYDNVRIAKMMGAKFIQTKVGYNPALQAAARREHAKQPQAYLLEYALSVGGSPERIEAFYRFCAEQVNNLPDVEYILAPAGSCNTAIGLLYGLALRKPKRLREVHLFGIAPSRRDWYEQRLQLIEQVSGVKISTTFAREYDKATEGPYVLRYHDLHGMGVADWETLVPGRIGEIELHPRYEGKIWQYIQSHPEQFQAMLESGEALLWLVGTDCRAEAVASYVQELA